MPVNLSSLVSFFSPPEPLPDWTDVYFTGHPMMGEDISCSCNYGRNWFWWRVPAGVTCGEFYIVGAGGAGAGACCCQQTFLPGGGGAHFFVRNVSLTPGCTYQISVGMSACCTGQCCGAAGCFTCICGPNVQMCAQGGLGGATRCCAGWGGFFSSCVSCGGWGISDCSCILGTTSPAGTGDAGKHGITTVGGYSGGCDSCYCGNKYYFGSQHKASGCQVGQMSIRASTWQYQACGGWNDTYYGNFASHMTCYNSYINAGQGGLNAIVCGGTCCCGSPAANGMVHIRYK